MSDISTSLKVLSVISRIRDSFVGASHVYTNGSCIKFAMILQEIFPEGSIFYDSNHAIFELEGEYYDINGYARKTSSHIPIEDNGTLKCYDLMSMAFNMLEEDE